MTCDGSHYGEDSDGYAPGLHVGINYVRLGGTYGGAKLFNNFNGDMACFFATKGQVSKGQFMEWASNPCGWANTQGNIRLPAQIQCLDTELEVMPTTEAELAFDCYLEHDLETGPTVEAELSADVAVEANFEAAPTTEAELNVCEVPRVQH